ncbi:MAG: CBS domain-containing protein [Planctomycetes bacterium]|nr:CBS domain-containing protein [Planctomycetota bacterium]
MDAAQLPPVVDPHFGLAEGLHGLTWTVGMALLSAVLAALEHGWQNLPRTRLAESAEGPAGRQRIERLLAQSERVEAALIALRVTSQMALVAVLVLLAQDWVPRSWPGVHPALPVLLACGAAAVWITLFCRVLPMELPARALEVLVRVTMPVIVGVSRLVAPPVELFRRLVRLGTRATPEQEAEAYEDEILATVEEGEREGHLAGHQADMIEKVVGLDDRQVSAIMTPRTKMDCIPAGASVGEACELALRTGRSRYAVIDGDVDHVVGVVHVKDLLRGAPAAPLRSVLRAPWFVPQTKSCGELLKQFRARRTHIAIVLDEYGGTAGLVTIEDVLEAIVGEIDDEFDADERAEDLQVLDDRHALASGALRVDELNARLSLALPESEDYDTLGGLVSATLGRLPVEGEIVRLENVKLTVKRVIERRVERVAIEILQAVS